MPAVIANILVFHMCCHPWGRLSFTVRLLYSVQVTRWNNLMAGGWYTAPFVLSDFCNDSFVQVRKIWITLLITSMIGWKALPSSWKHITWNLWEFGNLDSACCSRSCFQSLKPNKTFKNCIRDGWDIGISIRIGRFYRIIFLLCVHSSTETPWQVNGLSVLVYLSFSSQHRRQMENWVFGNT